MTIHEAKHICRIEYISGYFISLRQSYQDMVDTIGKEAAKLGYDRCISFLIDELLSAVSEGFISQKGFKELMTAVNDWTSANAKCFAESDVITLSTTGEVSGGSVGREPEEYQKEYRLGCVITPKDIDQLPLLTPRTQFIAPVPVDLRDYCFATRDQGSNPWCAAFAATSFASNITWRKSDIPIHYDPSPVYAYAKSIDGCPNEDGTSLVAVLISLMVDGIFDKNRCEIKVLRTIEQVKYAIHKFGCCLVGLNVSREWYTCNKNKSTISGRKDTELLGGHAVLACGYTSGGVIIQNSWDVDWGSYGFALITWQEFEREFMYGAVIDNCLYDTRMN